MSDHAIIIRPWFGNLLLVVWSAVSGLVGVKDIVEARLLFARRIEWYMSNEMEEI